MSIANLARQGWRMLQAPLGWLLAALVLAGGGGLASATLRQRSLDQHAAVTRELGQVRAQTAALQARLQAVRDNHPYRPRLQHSGLLEAREDRLAWVEQFAQISRTRPDLGLQYRIAPQRQLQGTAPAGPLAVLASPLNLRYAARHEEDFSRLHEAVRALPGLALPQRCHLARAREVAAMLVDCDYLQVSLGQPGTPGGARK